MIKTQIQKDQVTAMKSQNQEELQVLRYILAQIKNSEIEKHTELSDEEIVSLLRKEQKKIQDSIDAFTKANRMDLVEEHTIQSQIVNRYLPPELSNEDLQSKVDAVIEKNSELFANNPRAVIGMCVGELNSQAESARIVSCVNKRIQEEPSF